jgi:hypothetical protein
MLLSSVTPLANLSYEQQLDWKLKEARKIGTNLLKGFHDSGITGAKKRDLNDLISPVRSLYQF